MVRKLLRYEKGFVSVSPVTHFLQYNAPDLLEYPFAYLQKHCQQTDTLDLAMCLLVCNQTIFTELVSIHFDQFPVDSRVFEH